MGFAFFLAGLALIAMPGICSKSGRSLQPAEWARTSLGCVAAGWLLIEITALLYAVPSMLNFVGGSHLDAFCDRMIEQFAPGGPVAVIVAGVIALVLPAFAIQSVSRMRRSRLTVFSEAACGQHSTHAGYDVVTLPITEPIACSVRSATSQILISTGISNCLSDDQLTMVLDHEAAHLDHHHQAYLTVSGIVDRTLGWLPFVRNSTAEVRLSVERWADEVASGTPGAARQTLRDALAAVAMTMVAPGVAGLSSMDTLATRLHALNHPSAQPTRKVRLAAHLPSGLTLLGVVVALYLCRTQVLMMLAIIGHCAD